MTMLASPSPNAPASGRVAVLPLRRRVLVATGLGCLAVAGLASLVRTWLPTAPTQPLVAVGVFAALMTIALIAMREHHPFPRFGPANHVTMLRGMLAAMAASMLLEPAESSVAWALAGAALMGATLDGIDGWLARHTRMSSAFGARFDMEIDAFFMLVLSALVWRHHKAGSWVIAIGLMRYAFVAAGSLLPWLAAPLRSTQRGKTVAVGQLAALGAAILPSVPVRASTLICAAALSALVWSFAIDVRFLWVHRSTPSTKPGS